MTKKIVISACLLWLLSVDAVAVAGDLRPELPKVDMNQMYGGWYLIATLPNWFEKGLVQPYDVFSRRDDGDIQEDFYARWGAFDAPLKHYVVHDWVRKGTNNAHWRVQPIWPINVPFLVLYVDPDDRFVIFGEEDRKLGWIYSRTSTVSDSDYGRLAEQLLSLGYDPEKFVRFLHNPQQFHKSGFWIDGVSDPASTTAK